MTNVEYQLQVKIPLKDIKAGNANSPQIIGFDLQVNDSNEHGGRQSSATWNDFTGALPHSTAGFDHLELVK